MFLLLIRSVNIISSVHVCLNKKYIYIAQTVLPSAFTILTCSGEDLYKLLAFVPILFLCVIVLLICCNVQFWKKKLFKLNRKCGTQNFDFFFFFFFFFFGKQNG